MPSVVPDVPANVDAVESRLRGRRWAYSFPGVEGLAASEARRSSQASIIGNRSQPQNGSRPTRKNGEPNTPLSSASAVLLRNTCRASSVSSQHLRESALSVYPPARANTASVDRRLRLRENSDEMRLSRMPPHDPDLVRPASSMHVPETATGTDDRHIV